MTDICKECKERQVFVRKRGLCSPCYALLRKKEGGFLTSNIPCAVTQKKYKNISEMNFIKNYFSHNNWIYQPVQFNLESEKYSPDFYDGERNVFIEVSGNRQAFHINKDKYELLKKNFPKISFEIRTSDGQLLEEDDNGRKIWRIQ